MEDRPRQQFGAEELAVVLSRYDLGVIESITPFNRGSRQSPKVGVVCERGKFLLKKRAKGRKGGGKVAFAHLIQQHLADGGFPLPRIMAPRTSDATYVQIGAERYELFEYISGHSFDGTISQTHESGRTLSRFHHQLGDFDLPGDAPSGVYHDTVGVRTALNAIPSSIDSHDSVMGNEAELLSLTQRLFDAYDEAAEQVNAVGIDEKPLQVVHGDWHPGNMLFRQDRVVAVVDYDSCRAAQDLFDVANGALQFSITTGSRAEDWPDHLDEERFTAFLVGYEERSPIPKEFRSAIVPLMIEALIGESVLPIARTGSFGTWTGFGFLRIVGRKVEWLRAHGDRLAAWSPSQTS